MKPTYREKNLLDYLFGGFRSTLKSAPFMVPDLQLPRNLVHPLRNDPVLKIPRVNHVQTQLAPVTLLLVICLVFFNKKSVTKQK